MISREGIDQERVNELLVELGRAGLDVVRLKGGDPFVFGRGGEEALALAEAGIAVRGRPRCQLDRRRAGRGAGPGDAPRRLPTRSRSRPAHGADGGEPDYAALVAGGGTIVLFMALERLGRVAAG